MQYRLQLFLAFSLVFLAVLSEAKDKKKDKDDKKLKAKVLDATVVNRDWPEPNDKQKDWLLDADYTKFMDKWQKLADAEVKKLGNISKNNFSAEGVCSKKYKCETITFPSSANIDKDVKNPAKKLKPIAMKKMDTFLEHLKKRKPIKLTHHVQKDSLLAAEVHHSGIVLRLTERKGKEISGEHAAALAFDAYKYIVMGSEAQAIRAMAVQTEGKPEQFRSACLFPKGANRAQADNFCRGKDADADEEDEKEAKEKKKDDEDSCPAEGEKKKSKSLKETGSGLFDLLKAMLGLKDDKKDAKKDSKKGKSDKKCKKEDKKDKKEKKEKKKDEKKDEKKGEKKDEDDSDSSGFELEQVIIKVAPKKSDKGDGDDDSEDVSSKKEKKVKSAEKKEPKKKSKSADDDDEMDMEAVFGDDDTSSKKKSDKKQKSEKKKSSKKAKKAKKAKAKTEDDEDDFEDESKSSKKKPVTKKLSEKNEALKKKAKKEAAKLKKAAKKEVAKLTKDKDDVESDFEDEKSGKKKSNKKKNAPKKDEKKKDKKKKNDDEDSKIWARSAEPEAAYLGAEPMDYLYGRSNELRYAQYPRQSQINALRKRQQILRGAALARRALDFEDNDLIARARMIREPMQRREAEPEAEAEAQPEPEPIPEPEAEAEAEAIPEASPEATPEEKGGYLFSRAFFDDVETLLARQSPEFHEEAQGFFERSLGLDYDAEDYYEW